VNQLNGSPYLFVPFFRLWVLAVLDHDFRKQLHADGKVGQPVCIVIWVFSRSRSMI
jgi:hypothetical protein